MSPFDVLVAIGVYAILGVLIWIGLTLHIVRADVSRHRDAKPKPIHPHLSDPPHVHYAVWEWRDARWRLVTDNLPAGVDPGPPPWYPGSIEGENAKTWARSDRAKAD